MNKNVAFFIFVLYIINMKIILNELKEGKTDFNYELKKNQSEEIFGDSEIDKVHLIASGWIQRKGLEFVLYLKVEGDGKLVCARCLEKFTYKFDDDFTYNIFLGKDPALSKREYNFSEQDVASLYIENFELDILPLIKEIVLLTLPMKPLCSEECKGLCPVCGINRNKKECDHNTGERYSPFVELLDKFKKEKQGSSPVKKRE